MESQARVQMLTQLPISSVISGRLLSPLASASETVVKINLHISCEVFRVLLDSMEKLGNG